MPIPLLLLPGLCDDARLWSHQLAHLGDLARPRVVELHTQASIAQMAREVPGARLRVIEGCGHYAPLERPEAVTAALPDWLAALPQPA